jgi:hypothetical protein
MKTIGKKSYWKIIFYISFAIYAINFVNIMLRGTYIAFDTDPIYNFLSLFLSGIFLYIFYQFLKRGALTVRYLAIMFGALVVFPFLLFMLLGGVRF